MHRLTCLTLILLFSASALAQTEPLMLLSHTAANFGFIPQNAEFTREISLTSNTEDTLFIGKISTYCDCITAKMSDSILYPGESAILELRLNTKNMVGKQYKVTHIYEENGVRLGKITVKASVYKNFSNFKTIFVEPTVLNFSQFGDKGTDEAEFFIKNVSEETVPLELIFENPEYFELDFPVFVEANKKARGTVKLTDKGKSCEFGESFTFKFINDKSQEFLFSMPVKRKVFSGNN